MGNKVAYLIESGVEMGQSNQSIIEDPAILSFLHKTERVEFGLSTVNHSL